MWTKYSSAPCTESPETIQIVSGTVLERLFYRALDAKGNIIFCIKSSLIRALDAKGNWMLKGI